MSKFAALLSQTCLVLTSLWLGLLNSDKAFAGQLDSLEQVVTQASHHRGLVESYAFMFTSIRPEIDIALDTAAIRVNNPPFIDQFIGDYKIVQLVVGSQTIPRLDRKTANMDSALGAAICDELDRVVETVRMIEGEL